MNVHNIILHRYSCQNDEIDAFLWSSSQNDEEKTTTSGTVVNL